MRALYYRSKDTDEQQFIRQEKINRRKERERETQI